MKRTLSFAIGIATLAVAAGSALAGSDARRGIDCTGGPCNGSPGPDFMDGSPNEDQIHGLGSADSIYGHDSDDLLDGGPGADYLSEGGLDTGDDTLLGGGGDDERLEGGNGNDVLRGGPGDERANSKVRGLEFPEWRLIAMFGDAGADKLFGGGGDDSIEGEQGRDVMSGGAGNDYLDAVNDDTNVRDVLRCGKGFDRYSAHPEDEVADNCERKVPSLAL